MLVAVLMNDSIRTRDPQLMLIDAAGLQSPTACPVPGNARACGMVSRTRGERRGCYGHNATHHAMVADAVPHLVRWYDQRLARFDADVRARGADFQERLQLLRQLRSRAVARLSGR